MLLGASECNLNLPECRVSRSCPVGFVGRKEADAIVTQVAVIDIFYGGNIDVMMKNSL